MHPRQTGDVAKVVVMDESELIAVLVVLGAAVIGSGAFVLLYASLRSGHQLRRDRRRQRAYHRGLDG
jgi:hypothetical protein